MSDTIGFFLIATGTDEAFSDLANRRVRELVSVMKKNPTGNKLLRAPAFARFIHFNFATTNIVVAEHEIAVKGTKPITGSPDWKPYDQLNSPVGTSDYDPVKIVDNGLSLADGVTPSLSITNIYHTVRRAPGQSIICVDIFSHGFIEGPSLGNTSDADPPPAPVDGLPMRTPGDVDGRARCDFASNMGEQPIAGEPDALTQFFNAFAPNGSLRIYGCDFTEPVKAVPPGAPEGTPPARCHLKSTAIEVLRQGYHKQGRKLVPSAVLHMGEEFNNEYHYATTNEHGQRTLDAFKPDALLTLHYGLYPNFFDPDTTTDIVRSDTSILQFAADALQRTYAFAAANAFRGVAQAAAKAQGNSTADDQLKAPAVWTATPGVGALFEPDKKNGLMWVDPDLREYVDFYQKYFKVLSTDDACVVQRRYGKLTPVVVGNVLTALGAQGAAP
jgi:hypothetical protein